MDQVVVSYYAMLREKAQKSQENIPIEKGETGYSLYHRLAELYGFTLKSDELRLAVNEEFSSLDRPLRANDHVVFIPPVAGG
jgi:molybdopterin converting factor subunit 1